MSIFEQLKGKIFEDRKALHLIPEAGFNEYKTSAYLQNELSKLGIEFEMVAGTGIVALLKGISPTKTIAFRTDMDGLSVKEESTFEQHSTHENFMHACGHDGHMSMMLGLARALSSDEVKLIDDVLLIFQPAEEGPGGAEIMVKEGVLDKYNVSEIYGIHVFPAVEQGKIGLCPGPMMAMTGEFDIDIYGKSAHGAMPHTGVDAIVIASEVVLGLQTIVSRNVSPINPAVLTVGKLEAGERRNIIAGKARLEGTIRSFNKAVYNQVKTRINDYVKGIALAYDVVIEIEFRDMYPPVINDQRLFSEFVNFHGDKCEVIEPQMISEDFSYYQEKVPGLFYFVGTYNKEKDYVYPLHSSKFNFDNQILLDGLESYINILIYKGSIQI